MMWVVSRKSSMMWVIQKKSSYFFEKKICESRLKYLKHIEKSSNNWIIFKKGSILWVCSLKKSNSLRHMEKRFNSLSHILKTVQFFELYFLNEQWFNSMSHGSNSMSQCWKEGFNFYESMLKRRVQFLWVMLKRGFNTVSHVEQHERFNSLSHVEQKGSILRVICWKGFSSLSNILKRVSILWVKLKRWVQFSESYFSQSGSILGVIFQSVQCLEFLLKKKTLNHIQKKV